MSTPKLGWILIAALFSNKPNVHLVKQNKVYQYHGILFRDKKEYSTDAHPNTDETLHQVKEASHKRLCIV